MTRRPFAYLRRSNAGGHNGSGRVSYDVQRQAVLDLAARHGDPEPELIVEWGVSGADKGGAFGGTGRGGRRRAYHDLRAAIADDRVSALYAYSLSRLARSTAELLDLAKLCVSRGTSIRLAKEGTIDNASATGRLYLTVLAAVATFEAEVSAERAKDRNDTMREKGAHLGRAPYGMLIGEDGRLVPDPSAAPTVDRVLSLYQQLRSPGRVARALNDEGTPAPQGGKWADGTIRRILARQPGARPAATVRGSRAAPTARFARLMRCPHDGSLMTPSRKSYVIASGQQRAWTGYICSAARYDPSHPRPMAIAERIVEAATREELRHLQVPDRVELASEHAAKREDLVGRRERLIDALESGTITKADAEPRLSRMATDLDALDAAAEVVDIPDIDWEWDAEELNSVLRAILDGIDLDPETLRPIGFRWRVPEWRGP